MQFCRPIFFVLLAAATIAGCASNPGEPTTPYSADDEKPRRTGSHIPVKDGEVAKSKSLDRPSIDGMLRSGTTTSGGAN